MWYRTSRHNIIRGYVMPDGINGYAVAVPQLSALCSYAIELWITLCVLAVLREINSAVENYRYTQKPMSLAATRQESLRQTLVEAAACSHVSVRRAVLTFLCIAGTAHRAVATPVTKWISRGDAKKGKRHNHPANDNQSSTEL